MAQDNISIAAARGNFLTWCIGGYLPLPDYCRPLYVAQASQFNINNGIVTVGEDYRVYSDTQARLLFGAGSVLANMALQHFRTCPELPLFLSPLADPVGGIAAVHRLALTGPATASGVFSLSIMDMRFAVGVIVGETAAGLAALLVTELNRNVDLPFTAVASGDNIDLTAKNTGPVGNDFDIEFSPAFGEQIPAGIHVTVTHETVGVGVLDVTEAIKVMKCPWDCIGIGSEQETLIDAFIENVRDNWRCTVQGDFRDGHVFHARTDTAGQIAAYGMTRSNPEESVIPVRFGYKYPGYLLVAAITSRVCCSACTDPARPVQFDNGVMGSLFDSLRCATIWAQEEKRAFYDSGILNWDVAHSRGVRSASLVIEEPLTTYKWNPMTGAMDGAWQRVESRYTTSYFVRRLGAWYRANYASTALVDDGTPIPQGRRAISARVFKASILAWLRTTQLGITMDADASAIERMVEVDRSVTPDNCDPNRLTVRIDLDLVNQLARIATNIDVSPQFSCIPPTVSAL